MARPKYKNRLLTIPSMRKKCHTCGSIKEVQHRLIVVPKDVPKTKKFKDYLDIPNVVIENYCSVECSGDEFINNYSPEDFYQE